MLPKLSKITIFLSATVAMLCSMYVLAVISLFASETNILFPIQFLMVTAAAVLSFQGIFTLFWMLYGWEDPEKMSEDAKPSVLYPPQHTFSLLIPARFEGSVIEKTIHALAQLRYPEELFEVLILCKKDDAQTIAQAKAAIGKTGKKNIRVVIFTSPLNSKPSALNVGLAKTKNEVIGVFDAEDEPSEHILDVVNTVFLTQQVDVVQGGVQLMNDHTTWFSPLNVLEYYFWYRSALHLFSKMHVVPLGGNTVFFKRQSLIAGDGWRERLTEDAEIGLRYSRENKLIRILYDARIATAEESPANVSALLRQRTRWNQGFLQILFDRSWLQFPEFKRKIFAGYFLLLAQLNALNFIMVFGALLTLFIDLPVFATLVVLFPMYLLGLQLLTQLLGYYEFTKEFSRPFSLGMCAKIIIGFIPYQIVLAFAAFRALVRHLKSEEDWEQTPHENLHRVSS